MSLTHCLINVFHFQHFYTTNRSKVPIGEFELHKLSINFLHYTQAKQQMHKEKNDQSNLA